MHILLLNYTNLKALGQFENLVFVIMSTRENICLIARTPCADKYNLIELSDLVGFGYDPSDTHDELKCWRMGFPLLSDKDSGE